MLVILGSHVLISIFILRVLLIKINFGVQIKLLLLLLLLLMLLLLLLLLLLLFELVSCVARLSYLELRSVA